MREPIVGDRVKRICKDSCYGVLGTVKKIEANWVYLIRDDGNNPSRGYWTTSLIDFDKLWKIIFNGELADIKRLSKSSITEDELMDFILDWRNFKWEKVKNTMN